MKILFLLTTLGLLSFKTPFGKTNLHTEYLPELFFQENLPFYSGFMKSGERLKDTTEIFIFMKYWLDRNPTATIEVVGNADFIEKDKSNLSFQRAKRVYDDLMKMGINPSRIKTKGVADTTPHISKELQKGCGKDEKCWAAIRQENRRVYFLVIHG
jgi:hypothetical protein